MAEPSPDEIRRTAIATAESAVAPTTDAHQRRRRPGPALTMCWTLSALLALAACGDDDRAGPRTAPPTSVETVDAEPRTAPPTTAGTVDAESRTAPPTSVETVDAEPETVPPTTTVEAVDIPEMFGLCEWKKIVLAVDVGQCLASERFVLLEAADE